MSPKQNLLVAFFMLGLLGLSAATAGYYRGQVKIYQAREEEEAKPPPPTSEALIIDDGTFAWVMDCGGSKNVDCVREAGRRCPTGWIDVELRPFVWAFRCRAPSEPQAPSRSSGAP